MAAEHRGSASRGSGAWLYCLSSMPAEIKSWGRNVECSRFGREETQMPPGVRGSDKRCEKTEAAFSTFLQKSEVRFKTLPSSPAAGQNRARSQRELERHLVFPVPLKPNEHNF